VVIVVVVGIRLGSKCNRRNEEPIAIVVEFMLDIKPMGVDECKWKILAVDFQQRTAFVNQGLRPSLLEANVRDALEQYSVLADEVSTDGPDVTPSDWVVELSLQDIPWS
jgi:hypothetical protein